jgi:hypothetical protein
MSPEVFLCYFGVDESEQWEHRSNMTFTSAINSSAGSEYGSYCGSLPVTLPSR